MRFTRNESVLLAVGLLGLILASLSGLSEHVLWLQNWCAWFSGGCRVTATFTVFQVHVWIWGVAFYCLLCLCILFARHWLAWLIPAAIGVEFALAAIMAIIGVVCVFCLGNAAVVVLLAILYLRKDVIWQALALILLGFMLSGALLAGENHLLPWYCTRLAPPSLGAGAPAPPPQQVDIPVDASQVSGPADAPVTIIEYSDFRCPACRRMHKAVAEAMKVYEGKVRWVFKNFPLNMHPDAEIAAEGAMCAAAQKKFWEFQDVLFNTEETFTPESLGKIASGLGLDTAVFGRCLDAHVTKAQVDKEVDEGVKAGINAVPALVIDGKVEVGTRSTEELRTLIDAELARKGMRN